MEFIKITIKGIVQGVGFRPFIYNLVRSYELKGFIVNRGNIGVELVIYKDSSLDELKLNSLISDIKIKKPQISYIESISSSNIRSEEIKKVYNLNSETKSDSNSVEDNNSLKSDLRILPSIPGTGDGLTLPPDVAICDKCLAEMRNPENRRFFKYPFIACAECGPRYTTVTSLPYDRERTTMAEFPFCHTNPWDKISGSCIQDYQNFENRRFHAQTFSCMRCGPNYFMLINDGLMKQREFKKIFPELSYYDFNKRKLGEFLNSGSLISEYALKSIKSVCKLILNGKIVAIMGIGGVHLVGLASNKQVIKTLRERKRDRKFKPFAIMVPTIETARKYVKISDYEEKMLSSYRRPIVLLDKLENQNDPDTTYIPETLAPGLHNIGFMLPYAGIHHMIFDILGEIPLIFTSGNVSNIPMAISPKNVVNQLGDLADAFLLHNRLIYQRTDDSVIRVHNDKEKLIRRSRGYVPEYIPLPFKTKAKGTITVGPELNSTGLVARGYRLFQTQHIGNGTSVEVYQFLKNSLLHLKNLLQLEDEDINLIAHDAHPLFNSTRLAQEFYQDYVKKSEKVQIESVQHHYAHAAGLMVDNNISEDERAITVSLDGVGYGDDGNVWGGEIVMGTYSEMSRVAHLSYIPMIGGDQCVKYPARMLIGFLIKRFSVDSLDDYIRTLEITNHLKYGDVEYKAMINLYQTNENTAYSSSCGRFLDAVASLLDVCQEKTYRGEPAMRLESFAIKGNPHRFDYAKKLIKDINEPNFDGILHFEEIIGTIVTQLMDVNPDDSNPLSEEKLNDIFYDSKIQYKQDIAASVLQSIGKIFAEIAVKIADKEYIQNIGLSGGVAYNAIISRSFFGTLRNYMKSGKDLIPMEHKDVPPGDAGISIGQAAISIARFNKRYTKS